MRYYVVLVEKHVSRCGCEIAKGRIKKGKSIGKRILCGQWPSTKMRAKLQYYVPLDKCPNRIDETIWEGHTGYRSSGQMTVYGSIGYAKAALKRVTRDYRGKLRPELVAKIVSFETADLIEVTDDQFVLYQALENKFLNTGTALEDAKAKSESGE